MSGSFKKAASTTASGTRSVTMRAASGARSVTTRTVSGTRSAATTAASRSRSLETVAKNAFNVTAHKAVNPDISKLNDVTAAIEALVNARLVRISDVEKFGLSASRLGMQPLDDQILSVHLKSYGDYFGNLQRLQYLTGFEQSLLAGLAEGRDADEIADDLRMDARVVRDSIATRLRVLPPSVDFDMPGGKYYVLPRKPLVFGQEPQAEEVEQFASIVSRFNEPATKRIAADSGPAPAVGLPVVEQNGEANEGPRRPEEPKVPTRSGRPIHPDTQRELARIYVDAHERAGMPVPEDVRRQAAGA